MAMHRQGRYCILQNSCLFILEFVALSFCVRAETFAGYMKCKFLCPRHEMTEGHIKFTLSLCVCVCLCVPELCAAHNFISHSGI